MYKSKDAVQGYHQTLCDEGEMKTRFMSCSLVSSHIHVCLSSYMHMCYDNKILVTIFSFNFLTFTWCVTELQKKTHLTWWELTKKEFR